MLDRLQFNCLGAPELLVDEGACASVATRKSLALLGLLLRAPEHRAARENIADILWSNVPREKAIQSLRQAVRQLRKIEEASGVPFLRAEKMSIGLAAEGLTSDLARMHKALENGGEEGYRQASTLLRGDFMSGFETLDPVFGEWLSVERERITTDLTSRTLRTIDRLDPHERPNVVMAGAAFLLKLDSAFEHGHRLMIRALLASGRRAEALQQLKSCEHELRVHYEVEPEEETLRLFDLAEERREPAPVEDPMTVMARLASCEGDRADVVRLPVLSIVSFTPTERTDRRASTILDEIRTSLGASRSFDLYESTYRDQINRSEVTYINGGELGSYLLRFRYDESNSSVYLQFENRSTGQILFNEVVELPLLGDDSRMRELAYQTVNRIRAQTLSGFRTQPGKAPFARWCQVEALLWEFSASADAKAQKILDELSESHPSFSLAYAGKASIALKKLLYYPSLARSTSMPGNAMDNAERAVTLDPWQSVNRRMHGWASLQQGNFEEAKGSFGEAIRINPFDPTNLMSAAEGFAYLGESERARTTAERASRLFPVIPRLFYEYLATIYFADGDFEKALDYLGRAPVDGVFSSATKIAALICADRPTEAMEALETLGRKLDRQPDDGQGSKSEKIRSWLTHINLYKNKDVQDNYRRGADAIRSYFSLG